MLNRRSFLTSLGTIFFSQALMGCNNNNQTLLKILLLQGSIPPQLMGAFRKQLAPEKAIELKPSAQLADLFEYLQTKQFETKKQGKNPIVIPWLSQPKSEPVNLVTLGNYWLKQAIQQKLIKPLNVEQLSGWQNLPPFWQKLVRRNQQGELTETGEIWGAPYRWGCTMIVYRKDLLEAEKLAFPTDWQDLWREEFKENISLLDQPREVIGLTLKKLGYSYNSQNLAEIPNLKQELINLHKQVKFYDSKNYLQPLILGDTWLAVGWSSDIIPIAKRYPNLGFVIPKSGTAIWTDLWVKPAKSDDLEDNFIQEWLDFCWQLQGASQISLFTSAASPIILDFPKAQLAKDIQNNSFLLPDPEILSKSEFIEPLSSEVLEQYKLIVDS